MLQRIRSRLSYANVMATIAVFLALGGGAAYAANTVFSTDIVNGEVKTPDLANGAVTGAKIRANAVNSGKVVNDSLRGVDIDEATLQGVAHGSSDAGTFGPASPLQVTVPNLGTFTQRCDDGGTPGDDADDEVGAFEFSPSVAALFSFTDVDNFGTLTQTHQLPANNGFSVGQGGGPNSVIGVATATSGAPTVTYYASADTLPGSDNCLGAIHAVRSN